MKPTTPTPSTSTNTPTNPPIPDTLRQSRTLILTHITDLITTLTAADTPTKALLYNILRQQLTDTITAYYDTLAQLHTTPDHDILQSLRSLAT